MEMIFFSSRAKRVLLLTMIIAALGPVFVAPEKYAYLILSHFYTMVPQVLVCLLLASYAMAFKKSLPYIEIRKETGQVYLKLLEYNFLACGIFFASELVMSGLIGTRLLVSGEEVVIAVFIFAKFLVMFLATVLYAYAFMVNRPWGPMLIGTLLPVAYHYIIEMTVISMRLYPYYRQ